MRNPLRWLAERAAIKDRDRQHLAEAEAERSRSAEHAEQDEALRRDAEDLAQRLRGHRAQNHFAERMEAAFHARKGHP